MKRFLILLLAVLLCVSLCACGKSEEATAVDEQIAAIGNVTLASRDAITEAEKAVAELEEKDQKQLDNLQLLEDARAEYIDLASALIESSINLIGEVNLDSGEKISAARKTYDKYKNEKGVQDAVSNYETLVTAEDTLLSLQAGTVISLIDAIGTVNLNNGDAIRAAQTAYDGLSNAAKSKVTNYSVLTAAAKDYKDLALPAALGKLKVQEDKVRGITWYLPASRPYYADTRSYLLPYIGIYDNSTSFLRLIFHYAGYDWLFFDGATILVDDERHTQSFDYFAITRDNNIHKVWESADIIADDDDIDLLWDIANSEETIVRFQGDDYYYDLTVSSKDKDAIKEVLEAYELLQ